MIVPVYPLITRVVRHFRSTRMLVQRAGVFIVLGMSLLAGCDSGSGTSVSQHLDKAREYMTAGNLDAAVIEVKNALQKDPDLGEGRYLLGDIYYKLGMAPSAESELLNARKLGYQAENLETMLLESYIVQGKFQEVLDETTSSGGTPLSAAKLVTRGYAQLGLKDYTEAGGSFNKALEMDASAVEARLGLAVLAMDRNDLTGAKRLVDEAATLSPDHPKVLQLKAEIAMQAGDLPTAEQSYRQAAGLTQFNIPAQLGLIKALIQQNKLTEAKDALAGIDSRYPDNPVAKFFRALIALNENNTEQARTLLTEVLGALPNHPESLLLMANLSFNDSRFEQSRDFISKFLAQNPGNSPARRLLATVQIRLGESGEAIKLLEETLVTEGETPELLALLASAYQAAGNTEKSRFLLQQAMNVAPNDALISTQLASSYLSEGDIAGATNELEQAIRNEPELIQPRMMLVAAHLRDQKYDEAIAAAREVVDMAAQNPVAYNLLGSAWLGKGDTDNARKEFEKALSLDGAYIPALYNLARIESVQKNQSAADALFQRILAANPNHLQTLMDLARIESERGNNMRMVELLEQARTGNKDAAAPRVLLGRQYLLSGEYGKARELASEAIALAPDNPDTRFLMSQASLLTGDVEGALTILTRLQDEIPDSTPVLYELALANLQKADTVAAQKNLARVLELQPEHIGALTISAQLAIRDKNPELARSFTARLQALQPDSALTLSLAGDTYLFEKNYAEAITAYSKAFAVSGQFAQAAKLSQAHDEAGQKDQARKVLTDWLVKNPDDVRANRMLAGYSLRDGDFETARTHYEAAVARLPNDTAILNNLSWLLAETNPARAEELARRALDLSSNDPQVMDTLGWILVKQGKHEQGLALLRRAQASYPDAPEVRYHIAYALAQSGEKEQAITELNAILGTGNPFFERDKAEQLLASLKQ